MNLTRILVTNVLFMICIFLFGLSIMFTEQSTLGLGFVLLPFIILIFALMLLLEIALYYTFLYWYEKSTKNIRTILKWLLFIIINIILFELINIITTHIIWRIPYELEEHLPIIFCWLSIIYSLICYIVSRVDFSQPIK